MKQFRKKFFFFADQCISIACNLCQINQHSGRTYKHLQVVIRQQYLLQMGNNMVPNKHFPQINSTKISTLGKHFRQIICRNQAIILLQMGNNIVPISISPSSLFVSGLLVSCTNRHEQAHKSHKGLNWGICWLLILIQFLVLLVSSSSIQAILLVINTDSIPLFC